MLHSRYTIHPLSPTKLIFVDGRTLCPTDSWYPAGIPNGVIADTVVVDK